MIGIIDTIYEHHVLLELYSMHVICVPRDQFQTLSLHEGDFFQLRRDKWIPLVNATKMRQKSIQKTMDQLFIDP